MKKKCRILLIFVSIILLSAGIVFSFITYNKFKSGKIIYATDIHFNSGARNYEILIDNSIVLTKDVVSITPANYSLEIEFEITKLYTDNKESTIVKNNTIYTFADTGKYKIACIAISKYNKAPIYDYIYITVVDTPTNTTTMHIENKASTILQGENYNLNNLFNIIKPAIATVDLSTNNKLLLNNNQVTALNEGVGEFYVKINYYSLIIYKEVKLNIEPSTNLNNLSVSITYNSNIYLNNDIIPISKSNYNIVLNYTINNYNNQEILCNGEGIDVVSALSPSIVIRPLDIGRHTLCITPLDFQNISFMFILEVE